MVKMENTQPTTDAASQPAQSVEQGGIFSSAPSPAQHRHIIFGGLLCIVIAIALTVTYYLDASPLQRLAQRYADSNAPILYEYSFDSEDDEGSYLRRKVVVSSGEFEYTGIDTLHNIGEFYTAVDEHADSLHYILKPLEDDQQAEGVLEKNQRMYYVFLLLPWTVYLVAAVGYQLICYRTAKNKK